MNLLVLGGTVFVGRHVVDAALAAGHAVTILNRGVSGGAPDGVAVLQGDRDHDLSALAGRRFDAVIDCSGYTPAQLARSGAALASVDHYLFVSTRSVYQRFPVDTSFDESAPRLEGDDGYGAQKARAEDAIAAALPRRTTIVRPGLIVGPYDPTGRFTYWPLRLRRGGDVLAPGRPQRIVRCVDARDLAAWCVALLARPPSGVYDVGGPATTMGALLAEIAAIAAIADRDARLHWWPDDALVAAGVEPWTGLPLWIPESDAAFGGLMHGSDRRAEASGFVARPLAETARDTLAWALSPDARTPKAVATLTPQREAELLAKTTDADPDR